MQQAECGHTAKTAPLSAGFRTGISRRAVEDRIEALIALLDRIDGDPDLEVDDEDCCAVADDDPASLNPFGIYVFGPGDVADTDHDEWPVCDAFHVMGLLS